MPRALVFINTDFFAADEVLSELMACKEVEEAFRVHGVYDIVAKIFGDSTENLFETVTRQIKRLPNVNTVHTMLVMEKTPSYEEAVIT